MTLQKKRTIQLLFLGSFAMVTLCLLSLCFTADAVSFAPGRPKPVNRTDIGASGQAVWVNFSQFNINRLKSAFFDGQFRKVLPNQTRDELQLHRRQMIGKFYYINARQPLSKDLLKESVLIPRSIYGFLGVASQPNLQLRILGRNILMYNTKSGKIHDILPNFLR